MNRGSGDARDLRRLHLSVFRYRLVKNGFGMGTKKLKRL